MKTMPEELDKWNKQKFTYRFPGGESQQDKAKSLEVWSLFILMFMFIFMFMLCSCFSFTIMLSCHVISCLVMFHVMSCDVMSYVQPLIMEIERQTLPVLCVSHASTLQVLYGA